MKYLLTTIALVAVIAGTVGIFAYRASGDKAVQQALAQQDAMEWLRTDFQLTDSQFAAIKQLHDSEVGGRKIAVNEAKPQERRERPAFNGPRRDNYEGRRY